MTAAAATSFQLIADQWYRTHSALMKKTKIYAATRTAKLFTSTVSPIRPQHIKAIVMIHHLMLIALWTVYATCLATVRHEDRRRRRRRNRRRIESTLYCISAKRHTWGVVSCRLVSRSVLSATKRLPPGQSVKNVAPERMRKYTLVPPRLNSCIEGV